MFDVSFGAGWGLELIPVTSNLLADKTKPGFIIIDAIG